MESHFAHEEKLMKELKFPLRAEHIEKHKAIVAEMNKALCLPKDLNQYAQKLKHLMVDWVLQHIIDEDQKIAPYLGKVAPTA